MHSCERGMSLRDRTRRSKAAESLMNEGFRELMRTCPLYYVRIDLLLQKKRDMNEKSNEIRRCILE